MAVVSSGVCPAELFRRKAWKLPVDGACVTERPENVPVTAGGIAAYDALE
jgi:hypothetical protein